MPEGNGKSIINVDLNPSTKMAVVYYSEAGELIIAGQNLTETEVINTFYAAVGSLILRLEQNAKTSAIIKPGLSIVGGMGN